MSRIPPPWRWFVYWVAFTAALTLFGWFVYGVLDPLVIALLAIVGAPAVGVIVMREQRRTRPDRGT